MTERLRSGSFVNSANISAKMSNDLTPRKTMLILVIVVGCFAVLWPKVFYPMLVGSANQHIKPSPIDKTTGCCDVISEIDVNTIKIMSELCKTIIKKEDDAPLTGREIITKCQNAVLETCGIDISAVLQEQVRLGQSVKQILDEVRSLNGSLCLKYNFGVAPWRLGVPHRITVKVPPPNIRQERPMHLRSELVHPAFRERGRAIPQPQSSSSSPRTTTTRVVEGRPGPLPGMRPTLGGAGHVVPPPKQGAGSMGLIMPIYTIGIVIFFTYTVLKIVFKKQPEALYPPVEPDPNFRREVFESRRSHAPKSKLSKERVSTKLGDAELDQLRQRLRETELAMERIVEQMAKVPLKLQTVVANGNMPHEEEQPSVKVLGMEMTASCEGGKKWSRPDSPVLPVSSPAPHEPEEPLQEIYLEGALPPQSHLLVADSATEAERNNSEEDPAVVLAGKMTLSVISLDSSENGTDDSSNLDKKQEGSSSNVSDDFEKIEAEDQVEEDPQNLDSIQEIQLLEQIQNEIKEIDEKDIIASIESIIGSPENVIDLVANDILTEFIEKERDQRDHSTELASEESFITELEISNVEVIEGQSEENSEEKAEIETRIIADDTNADSIENKIVEEQKDEKPNNLVEESVAIISTQPSNITEQEPQPTQVDITGQIPEEKINAHENTETAVSELPPLRASSEPQLSNDVAELILSSDISEQVSNQVSAGVPVTGGTSEPLIISDVSDLLLESKVDTLQSSNKVPEANINSEEDIEKDDTHEKESQSLSNETKPEPVSESDTTITPSKVEISESVSTSSEEKDSFEKLNEAISDLASEFRSRNNDKEEQVERLDESLDNDEEEIEYEYEDIDDEVVNEEIRNENRLSDGLEGVAASERLNGENQERTKYGTTSSVTLAENDISDEEVSENEDEEVEEIIEYITDDEEEEVEDVVRPAAQTNNTNHLPDQPGAH